MNASSRLVLQNVANVCLGVCVFLLCGRAISQNLQVGLHVVLPSAASAIPMPEADLENTVIVTISEDGVVYLGADAVTPAELSDRLRRELRFNSKLPIYIKADANALYGEVKQELNALHAAGTTSVNILASQVETHEPGKRIPPRGLRVEIDPGARSGIIVVNVTSAGKSVPVLTVADNPTSWNDLPAAIKNRGRLTSDEVVRLQADDQTTIGNVVRVIDICNSVNATVVFGRARM